VPGFALRFQPPLTFHNCLPHAMSVTLTDSTGADAVMFTVPVGGSHPVYQFDLSRRIYMSLAMMARLAAAPYPCAIACPLSSGFRGA